MFRSPSFVALLFAGLGLQFACSTKVTPVPDSSNAHSMDLTLRQQQLAAIETDSVRLVKIIPDATMLGTVVPNEEQITAISSRTGGRIEKLFIKSTGQFLPKGGPVYSIFSEKLLADEKEYLSLLAGRKDGTASGSFIDLILAGARNKLKVWGLTEDQIAELEKSNTASSVVTFHSLTDGYIKEVSVKEGMYIGEGGRIALLLKLNRVWIDVLVFSNEHALSQNSFRISSPVYPQEIFTGTLVFRGVSIEEDRRIQRLRLLVQNTNGHLLPGMMVYIHPIQEGPAVLAVPRSAVLMEKMNTVWVKTGTTTFAQRMVETGLENEEWIEILSGLQLGEVIVSSGSSLINSEFILKNGAVQRHVH